MCLATLKANLMSHWLHDTSDMVYEYYCMSQQRYARTHSQGTAVFKAANSNWVLEHARITRTMDSFVAKEVIQCILTLGTSHLQPVAPVLFDLAMSRCSSQWTQGSLHVGWGSSPAINGFTCNLIMSGRLQLELLLCAKLSAQSGDFVFYMFFFDVRSVPELFNWYVLCHWQLSFLTEWKLKTTLAGNRVTDSFAFQALTRSEPGCIHKAFLKTDFVHDLLRVLYIRFENGIQT